MLFLRMLEIECPCMILSSKNLKKGFGTLEGLEFTGPRLSVPCEPKNCMFENESSCLIVEGMENHPDGWNETNWFNNAK